MTKAASRPTELSLRQAAHSAIAVLSGAVLQPNGGLDWSQVSDEQRAFGKRAAGIATVAIGLELGDTSAYNLPPSDERDFVCECFSEPPFVQQVIALALRVDAAHGRARSPAPATWH